MFTKPIFAALVLSLLFCSGCAKNRWLSRRDYSEMQDPFMDSEAVADTKSPRRSKGDSAGRARLDNSLTDTIPESDAGDAAPLLGPKPIQQASAANDPEIRSGRIANAAYPREPETQPGAAGETSSTRSYEGPALSDFLQRKKAGTNETPASTADITPRGQATFAPPGSISASTGTPASSLPKLSAEVDGFTNFLTEKGTAATAAATSVTQQGSNGVRVAERDAGDFASWAQQQKATWSDTGESVTDAISTAPGRMKDDARAAAQQMRRTAENAVPDFNTPDTSLSADESAQPLMKTFDPQATAADFNPEFAAKKNEAPISKKEVNPFDDPFAPSFDTEAESTVPPKAAASTPVPPDSGRKPDRQIDDSFRMDSGWKPSHLTRP